MTPKRALIVDDSKSARVVLSRLLEKHDLTVDTRDSAESALQYLQDNRPDVIFMDHVMSGMDGLSAVQVIKRDPAIASIPIMMYTSQDGALYAGEARAIGAAGVLPKQMAPADIAAVLTELQVLPGRRDASAAGFDHVQLPAADPGHGPIEGILVTATSALPTANAAAATPAVVAPSLSAADVRSIVEPLLQEQGIDLRRFVVASLDGVSARVVQEVNERLQRGVAEVSAAIAAANVREPTPPPPLPPRPIGWIALAMTAVVAAVGFGTLAWREQAELVALKAPAPAATVAAVPAPAAAATAPVAEAPADGPAAVTLSPGAKRMAVAYGESPFAPGRVNALGNWLNDLENHGFVGVAKVTIAAGEFCLTGNPGEGYATAPGELPANRCDVVGNPADDSQRAAEHAPAAIVALAAGVRERTHGAIDVKVAYAARTPGAAAYPPATDASAAQWNTIAAARSFVEFKAEPRAATP